MQPEESNNHRAERSEYNYRDRLTAARKMLIDIDGLSPSLLASARVDKDRAPEKNTTINN